MNESKGDNQITREERVKIEKEKERIRLKNEKFRNEIKEKELKLKTEENIKKLKESGEIRYIENYVKRYYDCLRGTKEFNNLRNLLSTKDFHFIDDELESVIKFYRAIHLYSEIKQKILCNNPKNLDDFIRNYLDLFEKFENPKTRAIIQNILVEELNYEGNIDYDIERVQKEIELKNFELTLFSDGKKISINDIDRMSGYDFEDLLKKLFEKMGYRVIHTNLSKDQGADLIIEKFGERIVIQAKNWTNNVGNTGVQEIVAAIKHYNANKARVISSSGFTSAAIDLAETNKVELWDRNKIILLLNQYPIFSQ